MFGKIMRFLNELVCRTLWNVQPLPYTNRIIFWMPDMAFMTSICCPTMQFSALPIHQFISPTIPGVPHVLDHRSLSEQVHMLWGSYCALFAVILALPLFLEGCSFKSHPGSLIQRNRAFLIPT